MNKKTVTKQEYRKLKKDIALVGEGVEAWRYCANGGKRYQACKLCLAYPYDCDPCPVSQDEPGAGCCSGLCKRWVYAKTTANAYRIFDYLRHLKKKLQDKRRRWEGKVV